MKLLDFVFSYVIMLLQKYRRHFMDAEIIVELFSRIKALERDVAELKQKLSGMENPSGLSDETPYGKIVSSKPLIQYKFYFFFFSYSYYLYIYQAIFLPLI